MSGVPEPASPYGPPWTGQSQPLLAALQPSPTWVLLLGIDVILARQLASAVSASQHALQPGVPQRERVDLQGIWKFLDWKNPKIIQI